MFPLGRPSSVQTHDWKLEDEKAIESYVAIIILQCWQRKFVFDIKDWARLTQILLYVFQLLKASQ